MTFIAVMDFDAQGRVAKYLSFETQAGATAHVERFIERHPKAFAAESPGGRVFDWKVQDGALLLEPGHLPAVTPKTPQELLDETDTDMARVAEDVIDVLIAKGLIAMSDLPQAAQDKIAERKALRAKL